MLLLQQMTVLFIYMMIGYAMYKRGVVDDVFGRRISWLVVNIATPALTISAVVNGDGSIRGRDLLVTAGLAAIIFGGQILLAQAVPRLFRVDEDEQGVYRVMTAFNNTGYMGFPVVEAVYGREALLYAAIFSILFNVLAYTYGVQVIQRKKSPIQWRKMLNAGLAGSVLAIVLYLAQIPTPEFFNDTMAGLSGLTAPLSMIVIGIALAQVPLRDVFFDKRLLLFSLVKLLAIPIPAMFLLQRFIGNEMLCGVCMVMLATPAASITVMFAQQYDGNTETAAKGVALTTILSVLTIPIVSAVVF